MIWTESLGRIELTITREDAASASHQGECADDVAALRGRWYVQAQLATLAPETVRAVLREYGAWDNDELADHEANLDRLLWVACCDLKEEANQKERS